MAAITQNDLQNALSRASKLMQLESNGTLDKIAKAHKDGINESLNGEGKLTSELMTTARNRKTQAPNIGGNMGENAMNVPSAIRESFANSPIDYSSLGGGMGSTDDLSFLTESLDFMKQPQEVTITQPQNIREIVNEGIAPQQHYVQPSAQIDYPMIRTIVEEIVRKYAVSLNKKIINESKQTPNQVNTIALGETFKFLDNDGNIYECTMKKVGNVKNKNKKNVNG
jgi:hypothetical protein